MSKAEPAVRRVLLFVVTNNSLAVAREFSLPRLAVRPASRTSLRPPQCKMPASVQALLSFVDPRGYDPLPPPCHGGALPSELRARVSHYNKYQIKFGGHCTKKFGLISNSTRTNDYSPARRLRARRRGRRPPFTTGVLPFL